MALIKCDECGREISSKSLFCPGCGYPTHLNKALNGAPQPQAVEAIKEAMEAVTPEPAPGAAPQAEPTPVPSPVPQPEAGSETPEEVKENLNNAVADYEATLEGGAESRRRNERIKVIIFIGVFLALLITVLYFYFTAPVEQIGEEAETEMVDDAAPVEADTAVTTLPDTAEGVSTPAVAPAPAAASPAPKAATPQTPREPATQVSDAPREIKVAPLSQQAAGPSHSEPSAAPDEE